MKPEECKNASDIQEHLFEHLEPIDEKNRLEFSRTIDGIEMKIVQIFGFRRAFTLYKCWYKSDMDGNKCALYAMHADDNIWESGKNPNLGVYKDIATLLMEVSHIYAKKWIV